MRRVAIVFLALCATASAQILDDVLATPRAALERLEKNFLSTMTHDTHRMSLLDAALHTFNQTFNPCRPGWMMDRTGRCTVCDFTLSQVPGCNACEEPGVCSGCGEGYKYVAPGASPNNLKTGTCICETAHLQDPNCAQCGIAGGCDQCYNGYFPDPDTKVCKKCTWMEDNCLVCESMDVCNVCAEGYFLHADASCRRCKPGCMECEDGYKHAGTPNPRHAPHRHCKKCMQGLYPDRTKGKPTSGVGACIPAAVSNCVVPSEFDARVCVECADGFSLAVNGTSCDPCKTGCLKCADGAGGTGSCLQCKQDRYPDLTNPGACIETAAKNCLQASNGDAAKCLVCRPGCAGPDVNGRCTGC